MVKTSLTIAALLTAGLATVAQANLSGGDGSGKPPQAPALAGSAAQAEAKRPAYSSLAEIRPSAATSQIVSGARPTPRIVELPRSDGPAKAYAAVPATPAPRPEPDAPRNAPNLRVAEASPTVAQTTDVKPAPVQASPVVQPTPVAQPSPVAQPAPTAQPERARTEKRAPGTRSARYNGGEGEVWRVGRDGHGFTGTFGGCRVTGSVGPRGYTIDRNC